MAGYQGVTSPYSDLGVRPECDERGETEGSERDSRGILVVGTLWSVRYMEGGRTKYVRQERSVLQKRTDSFGTDRKHLVRSGGETVWKDQEGDGFGTP